MSFTPVNFDELTANAQHVSFMNDFEAFIESTAWEAIGKAVVVMQMNFNEEVIHDIPTTAALFEMASNRITTAMHSSLNPAQLFVFEQVSNKLKHMESLNNIVVTYTMSAYVDGDVVRRQLTITPCITS